MTIAVADRPHGLVLLRLHTDRSTRKPWLVTKTAYSSGSPTAAVRFGILDEALRVFVRWMRWPLTAEEEALIRGRAADVESALDKVGHKGRLLRRQRSGMLRNAAAVVLAERSAAGPAPAALEGKADNGAGGSSSETREATEAADEQPVMRS